MSKIYDELWQKRSLIYNFAISDLKIRYRNSILGFFWTFLEPLLMLTVLYVIFTSIFSNKIEHFVLYLLLGIIVWNMFSKGTQIGLNCILARSSILTQVYFPREIPAISSAITSFLMICFELIVFGVFMAALKFVPPPTIVFLPLVLILEFILILGISLPLSVLNVRYRDIQFVWNVILQVGFFVTPIFYKLEVLPEKIRYIFYFSPMTQIVNIAHDVTIYNTMPNLESVVIAIGTTSLVFIIGYLVFRRLQLKIIEEL